MSLLSRLQVLVFVALVTGCGVTAGGTCKDYEPLDFCPDDTEYVCHTSPDGCRQCTCLPRR